jgi:DnaJ-class molecular chaperone
VNSATRRITLPDGSSLDVAIPPGTRDVTAMVPRGSNTGQVLRLKGRGVPAGANQRGEEYLTLQIMPPESRDPDMEAFVANWPAGKTYSPHHGMGV